MAVADIKDKETEVEPKMDLVQEQPKQPRIELSETAIFGVIIVLSFFALIWLVFWS